MNSRQTLEVTNRMVMEIASRTENIALVRVAVAIFASELEFTLGELEEIKVAVSEAVSNAVRHGYAGQDGTVRLEAVITGTRLEVNVEDFGRGMANIEEARRAAAANDDPERMGMGFIFMESFMDRVTVDSVEGQGTKVRLEKEGKLNKQEGN